MDFKQAFGDNLIAFDGAMSELKSAYDALVSRGFQDDNGNWVLCIDGALEERLDGARRRADRAREMLDGVIGSFALVRCDAESTDGVGRESIHV